MFQPKIGRAIQTVADARIGLAHVRVWVAQRSGKRRAYVQDLVGDLLAVCALHQADG